MSNLEQNQNQIPIPPILNKYSYIRAFHASPNTPSASIYIDGELLIKNISYRNFTEYLRIKSGYHSILVKDNRSQKTVLNTKFEIPPHTILTLALTNLLQNLTLDPILDPQLGPNRFSSMVRFANLSPDSNPVDLFLNNDLKLFKNVEFEEIEGYKALRPGVYTFRVKSQNGNNLLYVPNVKLYPNKNYTIYLIGLTKGEPYLQVVIPLDGSSYIKFN